MLKELNPEKLSIDVFNLWANKWFLLTSGEYINGNYNSMTVAWGGFGVMWNKLVANVVVRPTRFTFEFTEKYDSFTLCSFPEKYKGALVLLGTKSGKDGNKLSQAGLTVVKSRVVDSPSFEEADLIVECKKIYFDDIKPENFLDQTINSNYPKKDYHRYYIGEIVKVLSLD